MISAIGALGILLQSSLPALVGETTPVPGSMLLVGAGVAALILVYRKRGNK